MRRSPTSDVGPTTLLAIDQDALRGVAALLPSYAFRHLLMVSKGIRDALAAAEDDDASPFGLAVMRLRCVCAVHSLKFRGSKGTAWLCTARDTCFVTTRSNVRMHAFADLRVFGWSPTVWKAMLKRELSVVSAYALVPLRRICDGLDKLPCVVTVCLHRYLTQKRAMDERRARDEYVSYRSVYILRSQAELAVARIYCSREYVRGRFGNEEPSVGEGTTATTGVAVDGV